MKFFISVCLFSFFISPFAESQNSWSNKADFGGLARFGACGFSIGSKAYIGCGRTNSNAKFRDFWAYDPLSDTWTQIADFGGVGRGAAFSFSIGSLGYVGTGTDSIGPLADFWEYDPSFNSWSQKADFGGGSRNTAASFVIGNKGYAGTGYNGGRNYDFWVYDPANDTWAPIANLTTTGRVGATGFSIGNYGYVGLGINDGNFMLHDLWQYNTITDSWTQKADYGGFNTSLAASFTINGKAYVGTGINDSGINREDFWEYDPQSNSWTQITGCGSPREWAFGFSIGSKGYLTMGSDSTSFRDLLEYSPLISGLNDTNQKDKFTLTTSLDEILITSDELIRSLELNIFDQSGKKVYSAAFTDIQGYMKIKLPPLSNAIYFWEASNENRLLGNGKFTLLK